MCLENLVYIENRSRQSYKISPTIFFSINLTSTYKRHLIEALIEQNAGGLISAGTIRVFDLRVSKFLGQGIMVLIVVSIVLAHAEFGTTLSSPITEPPCLSLYVISSGSSRGLHRLASSFTS